MIALKGSVSVKLYPELRIMESDNSSSKVQMTVPWQEGNEDDFKELHEAVKNGRTRQHNRSDDTSSSDSEDELVKKQEEMRKAIQEGSYEQPQQSEDDSLSDDQEPEEPPECEPGRRLLWACQTNNLLVAKEILQKDPSLVHFQDEDGYTALHRACYSSHFNVARYLLIEAPKPADIHALTADGWTPLHSAARWNAAECVDLLLQEGADVNKLTTGNQTPLHLAAFFGKSRETLEVLFMHPYLKGTARNCQGDSAKDIAERAGNHVAFFDLIEDGVRNSVID